MTWQALINGEWRDVEGVRILETRVADDCTYEVVGHYITEVEHTINARGEAALEEKRTPKPDGCCDSWKAGMIVDEWVCVPIRIENHMPVWDWIRTTD